MTIFSARGIYKAKIKVLAGLSSCLEVGSAREKYASKFIPFVGRIQFLEVVGLRPPFPGWLSTGAHS